MSFSGFSEDDIKRLQIKPNNKNTINNKAIVSSLSNTEKPKEYVKKTVTFKEELILDSPSQENEDTNIPEEEPKIEELNNINTPLINSNETDTEIPVKKSIDLDEFEARQRRIEESNRKRKELLSKALADRTRQTQEEAQRLQEIQIEFKKLDAILSTDVKLLRQHIEVACIDYAEAQKRYDRIEKEFLEAKLQVFQKREKKQMLTEHLCAIIEKNEERKAEKLTELLQKLNMEPIEEVSEETNHNQNSK